MTKERQTDRSDEKSGTGWVRQPVPFLGSSAAAAARNILCGIWKFILTNIYFSCIVTVRRVNACTR